MSRFLAAAVLGSFLMGSVAVVKAQDRDADHAQTERHHWTDREDAHWREYQTEHHKKYHDWNKVSKREQREYWKWRDTHPDAH
jgi:hypothetical protein